MATDPTTLESRLKALEAAAVAKEHHIWAWLKTNWAHFVTWAGIAYSFLKHM